MAVEIKTDSQVGKDYFDLLNQLDHIRRECIEGKINDKIKDYYISLIKKLSIEIEDYVVARFSPVLDFIKKNRGESYDFGIRRVDNDLDLALSTLSVALKSFPLKNVDNGEEFHLQIESLSDNYHLFQAIKWISTKGKSEEESIETLKTIFPYSSQKIAKKVDLELGKALKKCVEIATRKDEMDIIADSLDPLASFHTFGEDLIRGSEKFLGTDYLVGNLLFNYIIKKKGNSELGRDKQFIEHYIGERGLCIKLREEALEFLGKNQDKRAEKACRAVSNMKLPENKGPRLFGSCSEGELFYACFRKVDKKKRLVSYSITQDLGKNGKNKYFMHDSLLFSFNNHRAYVKEVSTNREPTVAGLNFEFDKEISVENGGIGIVSYEYDPLNKKYLPVKSPYLENSAIINLEKKLNSNQQRKWNLRMF